MRRYTQAAIAGDLGQRAVNKAVKNFTRSLVHVWRLLVIGKLFIMLLEWQCVFLQLKRAPFIRHTLCCTWTGEMAKWLLEKNNKFVVVKVNEMSFGTFTWI